MSFLDVFFMVVRCDAIGGEVDGKLRIAAHTSKWLVPFVHNPGVHERFYGHDLKKEIVVLENMPWRLLV